MEAPVLVSQFLTVVRAVQDSEYVAIIFVAFLQFLMKGRTSALSYGGETVTMISNTASQEECG